MSGDLTMIVTCNDGIIMIMTMIFNDRIIMRHSPVTFVHKIVTGTAVGDRKWKAGLARARRPVLR